MQTMKHLVYARGVLIALIVCTLSSLVGLRIMNVMFTQYKWKPSSAVDENVIQNVSHMKSWNSDYMAEMDSVERKRRIEKACKKYYNQSNILGVSSYDKHTKLMRFNVLHHLVVNEKHKVLYCFIPKIACSNMKRIFLVLAGLYPDVKKVDVDKANREILRLYGFKKNQIQNMLNDYYKFMLVRDPFERLVSAYRDKWLGKENTYFPDTLGKTIIRRYRFNDSKDVNPKGDGVTFTEYIRHIIDTPSEKLNEHWMPYNDLCRPCEVNYGFIGSIDTVSRDIPHVMRQINVDETKYYLKPAGEGSLIRTKESTAKYLKELPEKVFNDLVNKFRLDHELFGYAIPDYNDLHTRYDMTNKDKLKIKIQTT